MILLSVCADHGKEQK